MKRGHDEIEFYAKIIRRAQRVRELAAESLRRSRRASGKENVEVGADSVSPEPARPVAGSSSR